MEPTRLVFLAFGLLFLIWGTLIVISGRFYRWWRDRFWQVPHAGHKCFLYIQSLHRGWLRRYHWSVDSVFGAFHALARGNRSLAGRRERPHKGAGPRIIRSVTMATARACQRRGQVLQALSPGLSQPEPFFVYNCATEVSQ